MAQALSTAMATHQARIQAKAAAQTIADEQNDNQRAYYSTLQTGAPDGAVAQAELARTRLTVNRLNGLQDNTAIAGNQTAEQRLAAAQKAGETLANLHANQAARSVQNMAQARQQMVANNHRTYQLQRQEKMRKSGNLARLGRNLAMAMGL